MKKKVWVGIIFVLVVAALLIAVVLQRSTSQKVRIGVVGPFTGEGATYGQSMKRGYELAFVGERGMQLVYEDDALSAQKGVSAINKLISADKVQVVLGSAASGVTLAMAPIAERNKVILFSSISTSDDLRKSGDYIFRNVPRNEIQGITAARFLYETLKKTSVVILKKNDEYATNLTRSFRDRFLQLGGKILLDEAYQPGTSDFRSILAKIKPAEAQAIYVPGNYQEVALFLKQAYEAGLRTTFMGGDGSYSPELIKIASNAAEGSYYTIMSAKKNSDYYKAFQKSFQARYEREPDIYDAYAYEAASILLKAVRQEGYNATRIKDFLLSNSFDSLTGTLRFDADGEVEREYGIVTVKDSHFVDVE